MIFVTPLKIDENWVVLIKLESIKHELENQDTKYQSENQLVVKHGLSLVNRF